jgi:hypothetical protein
LTLFETKSARDEPPEAGDFDAPAIVETLVERAVLTLLALPNKEKRALSKCGGAWPEVVRSVEEAYGYTPPRVRRFHPTAKDMTNLLTVWAWLAWLKRKSDSDYRLVVAVALSTQWHVLVVKYGVNERTVRRWHDAAICQLAGQFGDEAKNIS